MFNLMIDVKILGDADKRGLYDLYGEGAVLKDKSALMIETIIGLVSYYAVWTVFTYILTLNESSRKARSWAMCGEILMLILEVNLKFGGLQLPTSLMPSMTVFEFSQLLRSAYPTFMNGCRTIGVYFHRNIVQDNFMLGLELLKSNRVHH
jgi:hypothetical protein